MSTPVQDVQDAPVKHSSGALLELEGLDVSYIRRGQPPVRAVDGRVAHR